MSAAAYYGDFPGDDGDLYPEDYYADLYEAHMEDCLESCRRGDHRPVVNSFWTEPPLTPRCACGRRPFGAFLARKVRNTIRRPGRWRELRRIRRHAPDLTGIPF
jgi:hypothetical protein